MWNIISGYEVIGYIIDDEAKLLKVAAKKRTKKNNYTDLYMYSYLDPKAQVLFYNLTHVQRETY